MKYLTHFAMVAGLLLVFLFVWERVDVVRVGYQVERLKIQKTTLERERDELQVKFSKLTSPERIARVATDRLGLVPPQQGQVVMVHPGFEESGPAEPGVGEIRLAKSDLAGRAK